MPVNRSEAYPQSARDRTRWIVERRPKRNAVDARQPYAFLNEPERAQNGEIVPVATLFLTNRECPFRCLMCDLWQNTLTESVSAGDIPAQMDFALAQLPPARQIKLYNSGSFFDPRAIPPDDYPVIAERVRGFERVIVESHPSFIGKRCFDFQKLLDQDGTGRLEVAMGLETANPVVFERLNKGTTLEAFRQAAEKLRARGIALRVFILVKPPFQDDEGALEWAERTLDFAFDGGAEVACVIPTREGNGSLEVLREQGHWSPPRLELLEKVANYGVGLRRGRVFADLWDLEQFSDCPVCFAARGERLNQMNLTQSVLPSIACENCGGGQ